MMQDISVSMFSTYLIVLLIVKSSTQQEQSSSSSTDKEKTNANNNSSRKQVYDLVAPYVVTPQWLQNDLYDLPIRGEMKEADMRKHLRFPHPEQRYAITDENQELVMLSQKGKELVPSCKQLLEIKKKSLKILNVMDYRPSKTVGVINKHRYAEKLGLRVKTFGASDKILLAALYLPTGWPLMILLVFIASVFIVPTIGSFLVHGGAQIAAFYCYFVWGPLKRLLRIICIKRAVSKQKWLQYLAPPYYLEPRSEWKLPHFLRHDYLEDIPSEMAYKAPINKIDYTMYILTPDDYDELDLEMDELEFIDEILQFKDENPHVVARLLKHRLGVEKFYSYFDEDILSDEEDMDDDPTKKEDEENKDDKDKVSKEAQKKKEIRDLLDIDFQLSNNTPEYLKVLEMDEPWMHDEFDDTFEGSTFHLEEIRRRREIVQELKEEIKYLHDLITTQTMYEPNMSTYDFDRKIRLQNKAKRLLERYVKYSNVTKERIAEIEPSDKIQYTHNVALNKYLPLINQKSHYNHRLNFRHEKHKDPVRRAIQLDVFGGP